MDTTREIGLPADIRTELEAFVAATEPPPGMFGRIGRLLMPTSTRALAERGAHARAALAADRAVEVRVDHERPPAVATHEHGLIALVSVSQERTLLLDISSVADDPRWRLHEADTLMRRRWRWLRIAGFGPMGFTAEGEAIDPVDLGDLHGTALETRLTTGDGWPGDDALLDEPLARLVALAREPAVE